MREIKLTIPNSIKGKSKEILKDSLGL
jgi:hypothetical protein